MERKESDAMRRKEKRGGSIEGGEKRGEVLGIPTPSHIHIYRLTFLCIDAQKCTLKNNNIHE
jgi:hypothetical protein